MTGDISMNARPEDFLDSDYEKATFRVEFPTTVQLMNGVYKREIQKSPKIEAATHTSSGEEFSTISNYTTARVLPAEPNAREFGCWLERYRDLVQGYAEEYIETQVTSISKLRRLYETSMLNRRKNKNKDAIELLQSWIEEAPDEQQAVDLARLKSTIDEQRSQGRKLFK